MNGKTGFLENISLDDKLDILLEKNLYTNIHVKDLFPNNKLDLHDFSQMKKDSYIFTHISRSWDLNLIEDYANIRTSEANKTKQNIVTIPFGFFSENNETFKGLDQLFQDLYFSYKLIQTYINTLKNNGKYVLVVCSEKISEHTVFLLNNIQFDGILIEDSTIFDKYNNIDIAGKLVLLSETKQKVERLSIYNNKLSNFNHKKELNNAIKLYQDEESDIERKDIISEEFITNLIEQLDYFIDKAFNKNVEYSSNLYSPIDIIEFYKRATLESTVLYKYDRFLCDSFSSTMTSVIGDFNLENISVKENEQLTKIVNDYFSNSISIYDDEQDYLESKKNNTKKEIKKIKESVILNLKPIEGEDRLTKSQINLLLKIYKQNVNIILIIPQKIKVINNNWEKYCAMILTSELFCIESVKSLFDIITVKEQTYGQLVNGITKINGKGLNDSTFYGCETTSFVFSSLKFFDPAIEFIVRNKTIKDESAIIKICISSNNIENPKRHMIGFVRINLPKERSKVISLNLESNILNFYNDFLDDENLENYDLEVYYLDKIRLTSLFKTSKNNSYFIMQTTLFFGQHLRRLNFVLIITFLIALFTQQSSGIIILIITLFILINAIDIKTKKRKTKKRSLKTKPNSINYHELQSTFKELPYLDFSSQHVYDEKSDSDTNNQLDEQDEMDESEHLLKPKEISPTTHIYEDNIDMNEYQKQLKKHMKDYGLDITIGSIRELFSNMAASHLMVSADNGKNMTKEILEIFTDFIGGKMFVEHLDEKITNVEELLATQDNDFFNCIYSAKNNTELIHIMVFNDIELLKVDEVLRKIIDYSIDPLLNNQFRDFYVGKYLDIPNNVWFIINPREYKETLISHRLSLASNQLKIDYKMVKPKDSVNENAIKLSHNYFNNYTRLAKESYYLSEKIWKKFDELEAYFNKYDIEVLDNRVTRQTETFTTMFLSAGGQAIDAVDSILYSKILLITRNLDMSTISADDKDLLTVFEDLFGLDNLKKSKHLLSRIQENLTNKGEL